MYSCKNVNLADTLSDFLTPNSAKSRTKNKQLQGLWKPLFADVLESKKDPVYHYSKNFAQNNN